MAASGARFRLLWEHIPGEATHSCSSRWFNTMPMKAAPSRLSDCSFKNGVHELGRGKKSGGRDRRVTGEKGKEGGVFIQVHYMHASKLNTLPRCHSMSLGRLCKLKL